MKKQIIYLSLAGVLKNENKNVFLKALRILSEKFEYRKIDSLVIPKGTLYERAMTKEDFTKMREKMANRVDNKNER